MRRTNVAEVAPENRAPGDFMPDGSWNTDAELHHQGRLHRFVAALVRERRDGRLTPQRAAQTIRAANAAGAFPNVAQWADCEAWVLVRTATAAEECIRREGRGESGHWCGPQRWLEGSERDCPEPRHRTVARPEQVTEVLGVIAGLVANVGRATPGEARGDG